MRIWHDRNALKTTPIAELEQRVRTHPNDIQALCNLGNALDDQHKFEAAEDVFKRAALMAPKNAQPLDSLARIAMERYNANEAIMYMSASLKLNPNVAANWSSLGTMVLKRDPDTAFFAFRQAVKLEPNDSYTLLRLGTFESQRHQADQGLRDLQHAEALNPNDLETEIALGNCAQVLYKTDAAKVAFDKALTISPDEPRALFGAANVTLQLDPSPSGLVRAGDQIRKVMAVRPTATAYLERGHWNLLMRRYQDAIADLNKALSLNSQLNYAHSFLSQAYAASGQVKLARQESAAFLATRPKASAHSDAVPARTQGR